MIMIKDNHIAYAGGLEAALKAAKAGRSHSLKIEVEVDTLDQLHELITLGGCDIVLLDNMTGETLAEAVRLVKQSGLNMVTEASGNVTLETVRQIAESGVDYISSGFITHSVKNFDIGLDVI
jgi:nicotinate-nucleotide pyrophosphorylase (carboxylating)